MNFEGPHLDHPEESFANPRTATVSENDNAAYWTVGDGDFRTHGDFNPFVSALPR